MNKPKLNLSKKQQFGFGFVATILSVTGLGVGVDAFFDRYDLNFRSPIVLQAPVLVSEREIVSPVVASGDSFPQSEE